MTMRATTAVRANSSAFEIVLALARRIYQGILRSRNRRRGDNPGVSPWWDERPSGGEVQPIWMEARTSARAARSCGDASGKSTATITSRVPLTSSIHSWLC